MVEVLLAAISSARRTITSSCLIITVLHLVAVFCRQFKGPKKKLTTYYQNLEVNSPGWLPKRGVGLEGDSTESPTKTWMRHQQSRACRNSLEEVRNAQDVEITGRALKCIGSPTKCRNAHMCLSKDMSIFNFD